ncbi:NAD(P)-binding protein [Clostridium sp. CX1]|uniref:NAD(P)-binding protein n=1 Tax=Clostridium sp. CX1 TaxID=2978346 RepID=UPI0021BFE71B|nr:NAD(P)-binding protein [Clostridium sp. CX1]MCT8978585.1 NAD(P)-binding protein [Clostridium sp. CX1]
MKVAIMGAGLSGLACAIILEQQGIYPTIFEKRSRVGDRFVNMENIFNILERPVSDSLNYLKDTYGITLKPISEVQEITAHSKNRKGHLKGNFGYSNIRGRHEDSFENQLLLKIKSQIIYNSQCSYNELLKDYSHIVIATGNGDDAASMKNYTQDLQVSIIGATIGGEFNPSHISTWYNNDFAPKGYGYLVPFSQSRAQISIAYPEYTKEDRIDKDELWSRFYQEVQEDVGNNLNITDNFSIKGYKVGICKKPKINNTYFTGNCFGAIMPAYGCGQIPAMLTGIYAALDICRKGSYDELTKPLRQSYEDSLVLRRGLEKLDNDKLDVLVSILNRNLTSRALDKSVEFNFLKLISKLLKPFIRD